MYFGHEGGADDNVFDLTTVLGKQKKSQIFVV